MKISVVNVICSDYRRISLRGGGPEGGEWRVLEILMEPLFGLRVQRKGLDPEDIYFREGIIEDRWGVPIDELNHPDARIVEREAVEELL